MSIWRFADRLPEIPEQFQQTLGEGNTPLVRSKHIGPSVGAKNLYFKLETGNPTGSYKDRFAAVAISDMLANGKIECVATSSGNTGSALSAYCAAAKIGCEIAAVETAPPEKLKQMMVYGANVYRVRGFGLDPEVTHKAFEAIKVKSGHPEAQMQISAFHYSPIGMCGVKSISYEIAEQCDADRMHVFVQAGGGGLTLAVARGFEDLAITGDQLCPTSVHCVQPEGNDTIATALRSGAEKGNECDCTSQISGLQVPSVIDGNEVIQACRKSEGTGHLVTDEAVWDMQKRLAEEEGLFSEPAGAVAAAGALTAVANGDVDPDSTIVCLITGIGFKDSPSVDRILTDRGFPMIDCDQM